MKRLKAVANLFEAAAILKRVRDEFLETPQALPKGKQSNQHEIDNIENLAADLEMRR